MCVDTDSICLFWSIVAWSSPWSTTRKRRVVSVCSQGHQFFVFFLSTTHSQLSFFNQQKGSLNINLPPTSFASACSPYSTHFTLFGFLFYSDGIQNRHSFFYFNSLGRSQSSVKVSASWISKTLPIWVMFWKKVLALAYNLCEGGNDDINKNRVQSDDAKITALSFFDIPVITYMRSWVLAPTGQ